MENVLRSRVPGLSIREVSDYDMFGTWVSTWTKGWGHAQELGKAYFDTAAHFAIGPDVVCPHFLAYLHGVPVATATLFLRAGVAGIYQVATLPEVRRQGIGAAITRVPLLHARDRGAQTSILFSSPLGYELSDHEVAHHIDVTQYRHRYRTDRRTSTCNLHVALSILRKQRGARGVTDRRRRAFCG
jgi:GNAT superfamily N-acetyltransferase